MESSRWREGKLIAKSITALGTGNIFLRVLEAATAFLLLRWLSIFDYGAYQLSLAAFELFSGFFLSGLAGAVLAESGILLKKGGKRAEMLFGAFGLFQAVIGVILWFLYYFGSGPIAYWVGGSADLVRTVSWLFLLSPFENLFKLALQLHLKFAALSVYKSLYVIARMAVLFALYYFSGGLDTTKAVISLFAAQAIAMAAVMPFARLPFWFSFRASRSGLAHLYQVIRSHGKWAIANEYMGNIGSSIRPFIIRGILGVEAVAIFTVAYNLSGYLSSLFPIREVLSPIFPRHAENPENLSRIFHRVLKYSTAAFVLVALIGAAAAPLLIYFLFPKYLNSLPYFYVFVFAMPLLGYRLAATPVFIALREQKFLFKITVGRILATTTLGALLTYFFGLWGAAAEASFGVSIFMLASYTRGLKKILPEWNFTLKDFFSIDETDKELMGLVFKKALSFLRFLPKPKP